jgi:hypothetical protein
MGLMILMDDNLASNHLPVISRYSSFHLKSHIHTFKIKLSKFLFTLKRVIRGTCGHFIFMSPKRMVYVKCIQPVQGIYSL